MKTKPKAKFVQWKKWGSPAIVLLCLISLGYCVLTGVGADLILNVVIINGIIICIFNLLIHFGDKS